MFYPYQLEWMEGAATGSSQSFLWQAKTIIRSPSDRFRFRSLSRSTAAIFMHQAYHRETHPVSDLALCADSFHSYRQHYAR